MKVEKLNKESKPEKAGKAEKEKAIFSATEETEFKVKDSRGRTIIMRRPSVRAEIYFPTLFSIVDSSNPSFMFNVRPYVYVAEIDGVRIGNLIKKSDVDALIDMLGHEGNKAIIMGYAKHFAKADLKDRQEVEDEIKKLL